MTDRARVVRPCQPPWKAANRVRPVSLAATFRAFSLASAPLLQKNTEASPEGWPALANSNSPAAARLRTGRSAAVL